MAGKNRKSELKALFSDPIPSGPAPANPAPEVKAEPLPQAGNAAPTAVGGDASGPSTPSGFASRTPGPRVASGAVKAMGLSLTSITREAEEAKALRQALEDGERIIALDTDKIDSSFVSDRLSEEERDDPDFLALVDSIRDSGQQVPILVRRHPDISGRYQVAYGHRRLKAARRVGIPVKAIVRTLSDDELVLAQGKENAERRNLTFIERALFAKALTERGFDRKLTGEALAVQKSELSRLIQVADSVPIRFVRAVGPAPKAGRDRWIALGQLLSTGAGIEKAADEVQSERFKSASSDERFQMLFDRLSRRAKPEKAEAEQLKGPDGKVFARISQQGRGVKIEFLGDVDPGFVDRYGERLAADYAAFVAASA